MVQVGQEGVEYMYKVVIAGSRGFDSYELLEKKMIGFLVGRYPKDVEIVSGTTRGADRLGERFAKDKGCHIKYFPADWDKHGKSAGYIRNSEMAKYADACVVFMKKEGTKGSQHMIDLAEKEGLRCKVVKF